MKITRLTLAVSSLLLALPVLAAPPGVEKRQADQERRINQGVQSGQLTSQEAARLEKGQNKIDRMEDKAMSDGTVTRQERKRLQQQQDVQSRQIHREKHDRQRDMDRDGRQDKPGNKGMDYGKENNPGKHKGWRNKKN